MARHIRLNEVYVDIDSMFENNTPYTNFWSLCAKNGLIAYDDDEEYWYLNVGYALFMNASEDESRNQFFRDFFDRIGIVYEDFKYDQ